MKLHERNILIGLFIALLITGIIASIMIYNVDKEAREQVYRQATTRAIQRNP